MRSVSVLLLWFLCRFPAVDRLRLFGVVFPWWILPALALWAWFSLGGFSLLGVVSPCLGFCFGSFPACLCSLIFVRFVCRGSMTLYFARFRLFLPSSVKYKCLPVFALVRLLMLSGVLFVLGAFIHP